LAAEHRLSDEQLVRSPAEVAMLGKCDEVAALSQIEVHDRRFPFKPIRYLSGIGGDKEGVGPLASASYARNIMRLQEKRVAILGGTSGIGLAVARAALDEGASVLIASSRAQSVQRAQTLLPSSGLTAQVVDMRSAEAIGAFFETSGALDHVVFTAGEALVLGPLATTELRDARAAFDIRYFGVLAVAKFAAPVIRAGGSLVFTSGVAGARPGAGWTLGASITSAVEGLTRALAVELAPIRVNAVSPGVVRTPLWDSMSETERQALYDSQAAHLLVGHVGDAHEIATAYLYLMENSYATGTVVVADGGYVLV